MWGQNVTELFERGGPVMWPLLACSVLAVALICERLLVYWSLRVAYGPLLAELRRESATSRWAGWSIGWRRVPVRCTGWWWRICGSGRPRSGFATRWSSAWRLSRSLDMTDDSTGWAS